MQTQSSRYRIVREDLADLDPTTLVADGLKIGRLPTCELVLNHPTVSRLHAGINEADGRFYIYNFSHSSGTTLNGRIVPIEAAEALAAGDVVQIGPFFLHFDDVTADSLDIRVELEMAVHVGEAEGRVEMPAPSPAQTPAQGASSEVSDALNVFWEKRKREAGKMHRLSPLRPRKPARVLGKARFNWTPTRDLVRPWPVSVFLWAFVLVGLFSIVAAVVYAQAYMPAPISNVHARNDLSAQPAIAREPNASRCTSCHTLTGSMEDKCASCHRTDSFIASVSDKHAEAGIGCTSCHVEHQGTEFRPTVLSLQTCMDCHNDSNSLTYNGRRVGTPHGGTVGYPVVDGVWVWEGLTPSQWERKSPELKGMIARLEKSLEGSQEGERPQRMLRSAEFHALHMHRVKVAGGLPGNSDGELSCSSCHTSFQPIDRATPRTTCAACHAGGDLGGKYEKFLASGQPNCISCHTQHEGGRRAWGASLLAIDAERRNDDDSSARFASRVHARAK